MLAAALAAAGDGPPERLVVEGDRTLLTGLEGLPAIEPVEPMPLLERLAQGLRSAPRVDFAPLLGSGDLLSRVDRRRWQIAAAIVVLAAGLSLGERWLAVDRLESHNSALDQAIEQAYRDAFPQASRVVNARVQMQQQLDALRRGDGGEGFLTSLAGVVRQLAAAQGLRVDGVEYRDRLLVLRLQGRDLQQLNGLKQAIEQDGRRSAEIQSVNQEASGVSAQMKIREGQA
jgi:general secretion pathway protein L